MKLTLTALTVAASLIASGVSAFEMNTTKTEELRIARKLMVADLTVGVRALVNGYEGSGCTIDGKVHLRSSTEIETEPNDYISYYKITLAVDGLFYMTYGPQGNGDKELPYRTSRKCSYYTDPDYTDPDETFVPVHSINGFTDRRSFFIDLINQGYK